MEHVLASTWKSTGLIHSFLYQGREFRLTSKTNPKGAILSHLFDIMAICHGGFALIIMISRDLRS